MKKVLTLCLVCDGSRVLLGMKKRGFGAGFSKEKQGLGNGIWNGFGGKVEPGETIEDAAKREVLEEAGIRAIDPAHVGQLEFEFINDPQILEVHIFKVTDFEGEPRESEEMRPQWFSLGDIPYEKMWPDDRYWLPLFLEGRKFEGKFIFEDQNKILDHEIKLI